MLVFSHNFNVGRGETTPRRLRIFANHANIIDFDAVDDARPSVDIALQEGQTGVVEYPLRVSTFSNVHSLSLFFVSIYPKGVHIASQADRLQSDSVGEDVSRVYFIGFRGDLREPRKEGTDKLPIPAANAADAPLVDKVGEKKGAAQSLAK